MPEAILIDNVVELLDRVNGVEAWNQLLAAPNRDIILSSIGGEFLE